MPDRDGTECAFPNCDCPGDEPICEDYDRMNAPLWPPIFDPTIKRKTAPLGPEGDG